MVTLKCDVFDDSGSTLSKFTLQLFTNHVEDICTDYFIIIFNAKKGIWKLYGEMSEFTKGVMGRGLTLCCISSPEMIGSVG
jgi:hypothetical protein